MALSGFLDTKLNLAHCACHIQSLKVVVGINEVPTIISTSTTMFIQDDVLDDDDWKMNLVSLGRRMIPFSFTGTGPLCLTSLPKNDAVSCEVSQASEATHLKFDLTRPSLRLRSHCTIFCKRVYARATFRHTDPL